MREAVLALIVVGGLLVGTPAIFETVRMNNAVQLLEKPGVTSVTLSNHELPGFYSFGCFLTGTGMIVAGIVLTFRMFSERTNRQNDSTLGE